VEIDSNFNNGTNYKFHTDGADGWLAHTDGSLVFIKTFNDEPASAAAPEEGEIEIYVNGQQYEEVEAQGPYASIPAGGESTPWNVKWYLRDMPAGASADVGDQALIDFVESFAP
jgi:hypothetical protein